MHNEVTTAFGGVHQHEVEYIDQSEKVFLAESAIVLKKASSSAVTPPSYYDITEYFNSFDAEDGWLRLVCYPEVDAKEEPVKASVTNSDAVAKYLTLEADGFAIKESNVALIGETVTSGAYTYVIEDAEGYYYELGTITEEFEITTTVVPVEVAAQSFTWTYKNATTAKEYMAEALAINGLTAKQYNAVKALMASQPAQLFSAKDMKKSLGNVTFEFTTTPTANTDVQQLKMTIVTEEFAQGGDYVVVGKYLIEDCLVEITVPVSVKGMPELADFTIPAEVFTFDGQYEYELLDNNAREALWNANSALVEGQITKDEFISDFLASATYKAVAAKDHSSLYRSAGKIFVRFNEAALDKAAAKPSISIEHATGLETNILTEGVALAKPEITFVANEYYIDENGRALLKTEFNGSSFDIEQKDMSAAYSVTGAKGVVLTYAVDEADKAQAAALKALKGNKPVVDNGKVMWNDWNSLELIIRVTATLGGVEVGETTFVAYINDPVAEDIAIRVIDKKGTLADLTLYAGESKYAASVIDLQANAKNVFTETGLDADLAAALAAAVKYEAVSELNIPVSFNETTGVLSVADSSMEIQGDHTISVKVVYTYQFGEREAVIDFVVKPGTRK